MRSVVEKLGDSAYSALRKHAEKSEIRHAIFDTFEFKETKAEQDAVIAKFVPEKHDVTQLMSNLSPRRPYKKAKDKMIDQLMLQTLYSK